MNTGFLGSAVATVLTVYGIETFNIFDSNFVGTTRCNSTYRLRYWNTIINCTYPTKSVTVATVLTVYGIETWPCLGQPVLSCTVATVLTVYGIETDKAIEIHNEYMSCNSTYRLRYWNTPLYLALKANVSELQQYLPFTVLKPVLYDPPYRRLSSVATVLTVYGIETTPKLLSLSIL